MPLPGNEDYGYCSTCFDFTASYNEHKYLVRVYKISVGVLVYNSGWVNSTASKLCFKNYGISVGTGRYLEPDEDYRIDLTVARDPVGGQNCDLTDTYIQGGKRRFEIHNSPARLTSVRWLIDIRYSISFIAQ